MKFFCAYCHTPAKKDGKTIKMLCICDDDYRRLHLDDILFGFHSDMVYLLTDESNQVYEQKDLHAGLSNVRG